MNKNTFQSRAHLLPANRRSNTTIWPWNYLDHVWHWPHLWPWSWQFKLSWTDVQVVYSMSHIPWDDLDIDPMTLIPRYGQDMVYGLWFMYHNTKNQVSMWTHSKFIVQTDTHMGRKKTCRQTDRHTHTDLMKTLILPHTWKIRIYKVITWLQYRSKLQFGQAKGQMKTYPLTHIYTPSSEKPCWDVDSKSVLDFLGNLSVFKTIETVKPLIQLPGFFTHDTPSRSSKSTTLWFLVNLSPLPI